MNAFGTFESFYRVHLLRNQPKIILDLIGSTQGFLILLLASATGRLLDAGRHRYLAMTGSFFMVLGVFMLSLSGDDGGENEGIYWQIFLSQGMCMGLGMGCFFIYSTQVAASWFPGHRAIVIGITATGASIGKSFLIFVAFLWMFIFVRWSCMASNVQVPYTRV